MSELTGKQKRFLHSLGRQFDPTCIIGKAGITDGVIENVSRGLSRRGLIKIRLPAGPATQRKAIAACLAEATGAECVGLLGRTALLYRPKERGPLSDKIALP